ncbi:hypothetical protein GF360_00375 [candidate division WWE3 bacterium]|nr:hypothetical protein [candidate division WWE3 bacterium]
MAGSNKEVNSRSSVRKGEERFQEDIEASGERPEPFWGEVTWVGDYAERIRVADAFEERAAGIWEELVPVVRDVEGGSASEREFEDSVEGALAKANIPLVDRERISKDALDNDLEVMTISIRSRGTQGSSAFLHVGSELAADRGGAESRLQGPEIEMYAFKRVYERDPDGSWPGEYTCSYTLLAKNEPFLV